MANVTDPLINALSGSDPQNLMEYITRQKIYDGRFWKEECFGLTVADVLEKAAEKLHCIGGLPTKFLALVLKLLQLHPETDLILETFVQQEDFKYVRALGLLYLRLTARPVEIYETLEALYRDRRKLRVYQMSQEWAIQCMDEFVHQLLTEPAVVGIALPRLPSRASLQEAGYLPEGPRPTALKDVLEAHGGDALAYFRYKVQVEKSPAAVVAWERRLERLGKKPEVEKEQQPQDDVVMEEEGEEGDAAESTTLQTVKNTNEQREKRPKKKPKNYGTLFKKESKPTKKPSSKTSDDKVQENSEEYWNEERAKLGLKPLKK